jgi:endogenous inhibitor of DNA gyrase (YacG/DUF329 family)
MIKVLCPICQAVMEGQGVGDWPYFPFCSQRCKTIDLGRWLGEAYHIPAEDREQAADSGEGELP